MEIKLFILALLGGVVIIGGAIANSPIVVILGVIIFFIGALGRYFLPEPPRTQLKERRRLFRRK